MQKIITTLNNGSVVKGNLLSKVKPFVHADDTMFQCDDCGEYHKNTKFHEVAMKYLCHRCSMKLDETKVNERIIQDD